VRRGVNPQQGRQETVELAPGRWAARMVGNHHESGRRNLAQMVPGCASNLDRWIAQACNCDRRGRTWVSEVKYWLFQQSGQCLPLQWVSAMKLEAIKTITELLWNLGPVKPFKEGEMYIWF